MKWTRRPYLAMLSLWGVFAATLPLAGSARGANLQKIPPPPRYYVLDEPKILSPNTLSAIQTLLIEHDRTTGQQIMVAIIAEGEPAGVRRNDDFDKVAHEIFRKWGVGQRGEDNGALLAVDWSQQKARIEVGYGLEAQLPSGRTRHIVSDLLIPELRSGTPDRALALAVHDILTATESPLISNGLADRILRGKGGFQGEWNEITRASLAYGWVLWLVLGTSLMLYAGNLLTSEEAHFTCTGWFRPRPWQHGPWPRFARKDATNIGGGASADW